MTMAQTGKINPLSLLKAASRKAMALPDKKARADRDEGVRLRKIRKQPMNPNKAASESARPEM